MARTNDEWVTALKATGDVQESAIQELRLILLRGLRKSFNSRGVDDAFLEDVTQDALVKIVKNVGYFEGKSRFTTWAMAISVKGAITEFRRKRWKDVSLNQLTADKELNPELAVDESTPPEQRTQQKAILATLKDLIEEVLTEKQRTALKAELAGMPQDEIATRTGSNRNAIYKLVHDARKKLRTALENAGYSVTDVRAIFS